MLNYMMVWIKSFIGDEEGATAIEYGLIIALIALVLIVTFGLLGGALDGLFTETAEQIGEVGG